MPPATPKLTKPRANPWRTAVVAVSMPFVLVAVLIGASFLSDNGRVPAALAVAAQESGVMYCASGEIVHGDGSLLDRMAEDGRLRCTEWKLRGEQTDLVRGATPWPTSPRR